MHQEKIYELECLLIDLNTNLRILRNAVANPDDNDLECHDLTEFVDKIYETSNEMGKIFGKSLDN